MGTSVINSSLSILFGKTNAFFKIQRKIDKYLGTKIFSSNFKVLGVWEKLRSRHKIVTHILTKLIPKLFKVITYLILVGHKEPRRVTLAFPQERWVAYNHSVLIFKIYLNFLYTKFLHPKSTQIKYLNLKRNFLQKKLYFISNVTKMVLPSYIITENR